MNVIIIGSNKFDTLEYHLSDSFGHLGHDVNVIDIEDVIPLNFTINYHLAKYSRFYDTFLFRKISKMVIDKKPDLIICTYRFIHPVCIKEIKNQLPYTPVVHVNPDALTTFEYQQIFVSPYDAYFSKDPYIVNFMKKNLNLNCLYLPEAFNPRVHKKPNVDKSDLEEELNIDVLTFGYIYPYRANMLSQIIDANLNLSIYGKKDKRFARPELNKYFKNQWITGDVKSKLIFGSKMVFNNFHYAEIDSVNCKFFEIAGVGGFQICDYRPALNEFSTIDPDKFSFRSIGEAIELLIFYSDKPKLRYEIADAQYKYFIDNHTYEHRVKQILKEVFR